MIDFTSALYLGMRHASRSLRPWGTLTTGLPAVLEQSMPGVSVARALASLQGFSRGTLGSSTLHLFWDLFGAMGLDTTIYMDDGIYPIARWGTERAAARGAIVKLFPHHEPDALKRLLMREPAGVRPVVVADGFCPGCDRASPVAAYRECLRPFGGLLILDDTQALGILGEVPDAYPPFGRGGGGTVRWSGINTRGIVMVSSLAKGFGVPLAVMTGDERTVRRFEDLSETRIHCSPPSAAVVNAAEHALAVNCVRGDRLRERRALHIEHFRGRLAGIGLATVQRSFPVQTLVLRAEIDAGGLHRRLMGMGVRTVYHRLHRGESPAISFVMSAMHSCEEIDHAVDTLALVMPKRAAGKVFQLTLKQRSIDQ